MARYYSLDGASYIDINTRITQNDIQNLIPDIESVKWCSLYNLFMCPIGARGPIFEPTYGSGVYWILHEPMDELSATRLESAIFDAIRTWEPRVTMSLPESSITPLYELPGYRARLALIDNITKRPANVEMVLRART